MYQFDDIGSTFLSLPPNLQGTESECFGYALDRQLKKFHELANRVTVWSDLDNVNPKYYDNLAMTIRAPYYKSEYTDEQKLALIKSALRTRRFAGTKKAIEELLQHTFEDSEFISWQDYGGEPYHFKIVLSDEPTEEGKKLFNTMLKRVKAARSIIDEVEINKKKINAPIYIGIGLQRERCLIIDNKQIID